MKILYLTILIILLAGVVAAECTDTDGGKNKYEAGTVTDVQASYSDTCSDQDIKEYFCSVEGIASYTILPCVNGCEENQCLLSNDTPVAAAPEEESTSNVKFYFYGIIILIMLGVYIYLTKFRSKKKRY